MGEKKTYYVIKIKGKAKIPDYIQVRDSSFTLVGYFRIGHNERSSERNASSNTILFKKIDQLTVDTPFGIVTPIEISDDD
ncbi:MAG: fructose-6-phosphate aldolase [Bacteroidia bacterium]|nr:fructose-6-phosphate aldolase [Bacteroidia bacterium]